MTPGFLKNNAAIFRVFFHLMDPLIVAGTSLVLSYYFNKHDMISPGALMRALAIQGPILVLLIFPAFKIYRSWRGQFLPAEIQTIAGAWCIVLLALHAFILLVANEEQRQILWPYGLFQLKVFWVWAFCCLMAIFLVRFALRIGFRILRKFGFNQRTAIIVGAGEIGQNVAANLEKQTWTGINLAGFFDDRHKKGENIDVGLAYPLEVLGSVQECIHYSLEEKPDMVIVALPIRAEEKINKIIWQLGTKGISVFLIPDLFAYGLQRANLQQLGHMPIMAFNLFPAWKRFFDLGFSLLALILTTPLFVIIALLIKLEDGGPVFYRHNRIGESGEVFGCLKFRSMHINSDQHLKELLASDPALQKEWQKTFKLKNDSRVTRIGRLLRKTSFDELPQFINVLIGDMSIVGARPIVGQELSDYYKETAITYCAMKPGITGPWQVGKRSDIEDYEERVDLDRWYVLNASIGLDLTIIFKTILKVLKGSGAY
jgi:exopolysaccharide biosynthesis polyprenyl glycosylphosphotransferase